MQVISDLRGKLQTYLYLHLGYFESLVIQISRQKAHLQIFDFRK